MRALQKLIIESNPGKVWCLRSCITPLSNMGADPLEGIHLNILGQVKKDAFRDEKIKLFVDTYSIIDFLYYCHCFSFSSDVSFLLNELPIF